MALRDVVVHWVVVPQQVVVTLRIVVVVVVFHLIMVALRIWWLIEKWQFIGFSGSNWSYSDSLEMWWPFGLW